MSAEKAGTPDRTATAAPTPSAGAAALVRRTLLRAFAQAGLRAPTSLVSDPAPAPPHRSHPVLGTCTASTFVVGPEDLAASMGHPDPSMSVLGSPRIGLWFELATSELMPDPEGGVRHVGVGILVHHLGRAVEGETVTVDVQVDQVDGRSCVFACSARVGGRLVALGTHHRVLLVGSRPA